MLEPTVSQPWLTGSNHTSGRILFFCTVICYFWFVSVNMDLCLLKGYFLLFLYSNYLNVRCLLLFSYIKKKKKTRTGINPLIPTSSAVALSLIPGTRECCAGSKVLTCPGVGGDSVSELAATSGGGLGDERWQLWWWERSPFPGGRGRLLSYSFHLDPNAICVSQLPLGLKGLCCQMLPFPPLEARAKPPPDPSTCSGRF